MLGLYLENVHRRHPLIHNITNYVTVNDCANILLAAGASPIMADDAMEVEEITSLCNGLNLNIGTLNQRTIASMLLSGKRANREGKPVVLDPVGAGASRLRTETAERLLSEIRFSVIRGNMSEIKTLALGSGKTLGVDAAPEDAVTEENAEEVLRFAQAFSKATGAVIVITGKLDLIAAEGRGLLCRNGRAEMSRITGTGCQLSALLAGFLAANEDPFYAAAAAVAAMGLAGELGQKRMTEGEGNASYRNRIIDAIYTMTGEMLDQGEQIKVLD